MNNKSILAITLGLGLVVGSLAMGTYTIFQANQRSAGMEDGQRGQDKPMHDEKDQQEMLALLQIDDETFKQEADSGKSLAEIGSIHNVSRQALVDLVVTQMNGHMDKEVAEGRFTAEKANEMKAHAAEKAEEMVDQKMTDRPARPQR